MILRKSFWHFSLLISILTLTYYGSFGQTLYKQTSDSYLTISGISTLHDWKLTSKEVKCQANFEINSGGVPSKLSALTLTVRSESLKSGHAAMDKNTYSTLNADDYKSIRFDLISANINNSKIQCTGNLTVAGVTKQMVVDASYKVMPNQSLLCLGSKKINMSNFEIEAPTFMFGTVTTGDEVVVNFSISLEPTKK